MACVRWGHDTTGRRTVQQVTGGPAHRHRGTDRGTRHTTAVCSVALATDLDDAPPALAGQLAQLAVRVDGDGAADALHHRQVADGVAVGRAPVEVVAAFGSELLDLDDLAGAV